jgi:pyrroline-5-carboxylate reductase
LIAGLRLSKYDGRIVVYDRNPEKLWALRQDFRVAGGRDLESAVRQAGMLVLALRPSSVRQMLNQVAAFQQSLPAILAVSLAAGIPLKALRSQFGSPVRWVRAMPSPVCRIGLGLTALSYDRNVPQSERKRARQFFKRVGAVIEIPESQFDIFTAAFSPSHGYHALAVLAKAAQQAGLQQEAAFEAAAHALADGILYWRNAGRDLTELLQEAATPGGIAAATMAAMNKAGYESAVAAGLRAGVEQARLNAKLPKA